MKSIFKKLEKGFIYLDENISEKNSFQRFIDF